MGKILAYLGIAGLLLSTVAVASLMLRTKCVHSYSLWLKRFYLVCMLYLVSCGLYILGLYLAG